jgi:type II secretory pathway component PulJ
VVSRRRERGHSLMEVMVAVTIFSAFLAVFFILTAEMRRWEKRLPVNFFKHPQIVSLIARMRRDVLDAHIPHATANPYKEEWDGFKMSGKVLILETLLESGTTAVVVWDLRTKGVVERWSYSGGLKTRWGARGLPEEFSSVDLDAAEFPGRPYGVRITARDSEGRLAIDQILQPRAYH